MSLVEFVIELDMQHMMTVGISSAAVASFNRFYDAYTALNTALPDGQVLSDGVMCARFVTVMRGMGDEIAASIKAEIKGIDKTDLDAIAQACRDVLTDYEANRASQLMLSGKHDAGRALLGGGAATDPRREEDH